MIVYEPNKHFLSLIPYSLRFSFWCTACFLPFALVAEWGIWTVPIIMLVFFAFIGVEMMGSEIEDPFGLDCNDLPKGTIAHAIKENVFEILEAKKGDKLQANLYD